MSLPLQRILVIRHRFIGDTILTLPTLRVLRGAYPDAVIDLLIEPVSAQVLHHCPYVDAFIPFEGFWHAVNTLRPRRYDAAILLKRSFSSATLAFLAGIPLRAGFDTESRGALLTHKVAYDRNRHEADCFLDVLRLLNIDIPASEPFADPQLPSWLTPEEIAFAQDFLNLAPNRRHWAVHVTSSNTAKQWPAASWQRLITQALDAYPHLTLHAFGTAQDTPAIQAVLDGLSPTHQVRCVSHASKTTLRQTMACLTLLDGLIGVDSGTPHLAAALSKPTLTLFGPMNPDKWRPLGAKSEVIHVALACRPCSLKGKCPTPYRCMDDLSVESVWQAWRRLLEQY